MEISEISCCRCAAVETWIKMRPWPPWSVQRLAHKREMSASDVASRAAATAGNGRSGLPYLGKGSLSHQQKKEGRLPYLRREPFPPVFGHPKRNVSSVIVPQSSPAAVASLVGGSTIPCFAEATMLVKVACR